MNPIAEFLSWYEEAVRAGVPRPEVMALATSNDGRPSVRMVLYRGLSGEGLRFFTNYESRKGRALAVNPFAAACFYWDAMGRQVRVEGRVERLDAVECDEYFHARPRGHQLGAWASRQSAPQSHEEVLARYAEAERRFEGQEVPRPAYWGGYRIVPSTIELWQEQESRLHQRTLYVRGAEGWRREELGP